MITVENIPYISLCVVGIGFMIVIVGILLLAKEQSEGHSDIKKGYKEQDEQNIQELFSYFLNEEEKKNNELRKVIYKDSNNHNKDKSEEILIKKIVAKHEEGKISEEIAKDLHIGVGEVNLVLSLYSMR